MDIEAEGCMPFEEWLAKTKLKRKNEFDLFHIWAEEQAWHRYKQLESEMDVEIMDFLQDKVSETNKKLNSFVLDLYYIEDESFIVLGRIKKYGAMQKIEAVISANNYSCTGWKNTSYIDLKKPPQYLNYKGDMEDYEMIDLPVEENLFLWDKKTQE